MVSGWTSMDNTMQQAQIGPAPTEPNRPPPPIPTPENPPEVEEPAREPPDEVPDPNPDEKRKPPLQ
jgi:hypothetical protein